ncbi:MAG: ferritin-like domain-containing protein [Planctomycetaceae bacterium]
MKGDQKVIDALNQGLTIELTAINQYFIQSRMCADRGFHKLAKHHYAEVHRRDAARTTAD